MTSAFALRNFTSFAAVFFATDVRGQIMSTVTSRFVLMKCG